MGPDPEIYEKSCQEKQFMVYQSTARHYSSEKRFNMINTDMHPVRYGCKIKYEIYLLWKLVTKNQNWRRNIERRKSYRKRKQAGKDKGERAGHWKKRMWKHGKMEQNFGDERSAGYGTVNGGAVVW